jgi:hypothetical protein
MITEEFLEEYIELNGISIRITSYKIGDTFHCHVANTDPGATIARATATSKEAAVEEAIRKAAERIRPLEKKK